MLDMVRETQKECCQRQLILDLVKGVYVKKSLIAKDGGVTIKERMDDDASSGHK
jgi:hypothetical protein